MSSSSSGRSAPTMVPVTPGGTTPPASHCLRMLGRRADQRALQQRLVGHRRDGLLASTGEEQLLDARGVVGEAALRHRLHVVVVRLAAHPADVGGAVGADAVEPTLDVVGDLHREAVEHVEVGTRSRPSRRGRAKPCAERAGDVGIVGAERREPHRQPALAQLGAQRGVASGRPTPTRSGCRTARAGSTSAACPGRARPGPVYGSEISGPSWVTGPSRRSTSRRIST